MERVLPRFPLKSLPVRCRCGVVVRIAAAVLFLIVDKDNSWGIQVS